MNSKFLLIVSVILLCLIRPVFVTAEDSEQSKESRPQVGSYIQNDSSEIRVEDYITASPFKLEIREKKPPETKYENIGEEKESSSDNTEQRDVQKVEQIVPFIEKYKKKSTELNEIYRKELKEAIRNGNKETISQVRQEYLEKRKALNRQIVEQSKIRTLTETQKQEETASNNQNTQKDIPYTVQEWQRSLMNKFQVLWVSIFNGSKK